MMIFQRLLELRLEHELSQSEVAKILGINLNTYRKYERGTSQIKTTFLIKLADLYNVSTDYIVELTDRRKPW